MKKLLLLLLLSTLFLVGCKQEEESTAEPQNHQYVPQIPGGQIVPNATGLAGKVLNLVADNSQLGKITLSWTVPPIYKTMNYQVAIYKKKAAGGFVLPDPADEYSSAYLYLRSNVVGESFTDQDYVDENGDVSVQIEQNNIYKYWVYLKVTDGSGDTKWSSGVDIEVTAKTPEDTFKFPSLANFWQNLTWQMGNSPTSANNPNPVVNVSTLDPGVPSIGNPKGGIASAYSGNVMYVADTKNNRVVIYTRGKAYSCDAFKETDPATYYACVYTYTGYPLSAANVLGQTSPFETKSCAQHQSTCGARTTQSSCESMSDFNSMCTWHSDSNISNGGSCTAYERCLTQPSRVTVANNKLFISDAGNNRIVVYNTLPVQGHLRDAAGAGVSSSPIDGSANMVIGKKSLRDETLDYPVGKSSLKNPGGVAIKGTSLYIADTGNNRVVKIQNFADQNQFLCNDDQEWDNLPTDPGGGNGKCKFTGLLGQRDYYQRWSLKEGSGDLAPGEMGYDGISCSNPTPSTTQCVSPYVISTGSDGTLRDKLMDDRLGRYFRKPTQVKFTIDGKMLISSNEEISITSPLGTAEMRGRILVWNTDPMSELPSEDPTKCNAGWRMTSDVDNNFDSSNKCQASNVIGQRNGFTFLEIVGPGGKYSNISFGLESIDGFDLRSVNSMTTGTAVPKTSIFSVDAINNFVYYWENYDALSSSLGVPPTGKAVNPNGALNSNTGTYLPVLQTIVDINVTDNNLIYISDPVNYKVYQLRAYDYETAQ